METDTDGVIDQRPEIGCEQCYRCSGSTARRGAVGGVCVRVRKHPLMWMMGETITHLQQY